MTDPPRYEICCEDLRTQGDGRTFHGMQTPFETELLGFVQLKVGSRDVQVPIRRETPAPLADAGRDDGPLEAASVARFLMEGDRFAIVVRGDVAQQAVSTAVQKAAEVALRALSRKLLN